MPTERFAVVPNTYSISIKCCVWSCNIVSLSVLYMQPNFRKLCKAMDSFSCNFTNVLSEAKSIISTIFPVSYRYVFASWESLKYRILK